MDRIQLLKKFLYATDEEFRTARLSAESRRIILRTRAVYEYMRDNPQNSEQRVAEIFQDRFSCSRRTIYEIVGNAKICLGILHSTTREFIRWKFYNLCEEGLEMAREKKDPGAFSRILGVLSKAAKLDKDENAEGADYTAIIPQSFEITADPVDAGYDKIEHYEARKKALFKKYAIELKPEETNNKD